MFTLKGRTGAALASEILGIHILQFPLALMSSLCNFAPIPSLQAIRNLTPTSDEQHRLF
jgi:hypothetical protein